MARGPKPKEKTAGRIKVWKENCERFLEGCGAFRQHDAAGYEWCLHTNAGDLGINICDGYIHSRFDDTFAGQLATKMTSSECGATGKWNFYYTDDEDLQLGFIRWCTYIDDLLDYKPGPAEIAEIAARREHYYELWPHSRPKPAVPS